MLHKRKRDEYPPTPKHWKVLEFTDPANPVYRCIEPPGAADIYAATSPRAATDPYTATSSHAATSSQATISPYTEPSATNTGDSSQWKFVAEDVMELRYPPLKKYKLTQATVPRPANQPLGSTGVEAAQCTIEHLANNLADCPADHPVDHPVDYQGGNDCLPIPAAAPAVDSLAALTCLNIIYLYFGQD